MRLSGFLLLYILVYGLALHGYALERLRRAFRPSGKWTAFAALCAIVLAALPLGTRVAERAGFVGEARVLAYAGYLWMGFIFLFVVVAACCDGIRLLTFLVGKITRAAPADFLSRRQAFWFSLSAALLIMVYGWFEAGDIRLEKVTIATAKLPPTISRLRIVQISDVHLGLIVGDTRLKKIAALIRQAEPDLVVSTGDLVDGHLDGYAELVEHFSSIHPSLGKYAVTGNHEFYAGIEHSLAFLQLAGFEVLRGEARSVQGFLTLVGVDDPVGRSLNGAAFPQEKELLADADSSKLAILLKHRPVVEQDAARLFDLQLSGHIHQGQIFPFGLLTKIFYPAPAGLSQVHGNSFLYVSRGTGTWGPPIRFLSQPEVTLFEFVSTGHDG